MREVLITRPGAGAARTAGSLSRLGFVPVVAPVLDVHPIPTELPAARGFQAVLVTSMAALPALTDGHRGMRLLAVGAATAERARAAGHAQVESADGDAEALTSLAAGRFRPADGPLLLVSGAGQGAPLAAALRGLGFQLAHHAVYAARPVAALPAQACLALRAGTLYAATFFSAETARVFTDLAERAGLRNTVAPVVALAIGRPAAIALAALPWRCVRVAARPTQDELLALL